MPGSQRNQSHPLQRVVDGASENDVYSAPGSSRRNVRNTSGDGSYSATGGARGGRMYPSGPLRNKQRQSDGEDTDSPFIADDNSSTNSNVVSAALISCAADALYLHR